MSGPILNPLARRTHERAGLPVFRGAFPALGHLPALASDPLGLDRIAEREVGPLYWTDTGFGRWQLRCLSPESFDLFKNVQTSSDYVGETLPDLFGRSVITLDGKPHRHARSVMGPAFTPGGLSAARVGSLFADVIERHVHEWIDRGVITTLASTRELVLALILRMLGVPERDLDVWRRDYEDHMLLALGVPLDLPGTPRRRGLTAKARLDERIGALVREARAGSDTTVLAQLSRAKDEHGEPLADAELLDNLRLLILAGHETTATVIAWLIAYLAESPSLLERLQSEATDVPRAPGDLRAFRFAEALFREVLRLQPPVARDARRAVVDLEIAGRRVPAGSIVAISIELLSRSPRTYEDPDSFVPERWMGKTAPPTALELVQFGAGPHFCLGYHVAWLEVVQTSVILARALRARGARLALDGRFPRVRHLPLRHPDASSRVRFVRG